MRLVESHSRLTPRQAMSFFFLPVIPRYPVIQKLLDVIPEKKKKQRNCADERANSSYLFRFEIAVTRSFIPAHRPLLLSNHLFHPISENLYITCTFNFYAHELESFMTSGLFTWFKDVSFIIFCSILYRHRLRHTHLHLINSQHSLTSARGICNWGVWH